MGQLGLVLFIFFFTNINSTEKTIGFSGIHTRIVGVKGEHADHLSTTITAHLLNLCVQNSYLPTYLPTYVVLFSYYTSFSLYIPAHDNVFYSKYFDISFLVPTIRIIRLKMDYLGISVY